MPRLSLREIDVLSARLLSAAGVPEADAAFIASELADANRVGHDSHGLIRVLQYVRSIRSGEIIPGAAIETVVSGGSFEVLDANRNFGQVGMRVALERVQTLVKGSGVAAVWIRNSNHIGRLGSYSHRLALHGLCAILLVNAPGRGGVAPFGGIERRLGTNPLSFAAPGPDGPLVLDMTTSAVAEGKLRVAHHAGKSVPEGWFIDGCGDPATDPGMFYADPPGALLPLGGELGFKGTGLAIMLDVFAGVLSGSGVAQSHLPPGANGVCLIGIDPNRLLPDAEYREWIGRLTEHIRGTQLAPGVSEILLPGEIEQRRADERERSGVEIAADSWKQLAQLASELHCDLPQCD